MLKGCIIVESDSSQLSQRLSSEEVHKRGVGEHTHRRIVVGTTCDKITRSFEMLSAYVGRVEARSTFIRERERPNEMSSDAVRNLISGSLLIERETTMDSRGPHERSE